MAGRGLCAAAAGCPGRTATRSRGWRRSKRSSEKKFVEERKTVDLLKPHKVSDFPFVRCGAADLKGQWGSMMRLYRSMFSYRDDCRSHRPSVSRNRPMLPTISQL